MEAKIVSESHWRKEGLSLKSLNRSAWSASMSVTKWAVKHWSLRSLQVKLIKIGSSNAWFQE